MSLIPNFPSFAPVVLEMRTELLPFFTLLTDGICENTFASLFLDSYMYRYNISCVGEKTFIVTGINPASANFVPPCSNASAFAAHPCRFFSIIGQMPGKELFAKIVSDDHITTCCYLKNLAESSVKSDEELFESFGLAPEVDRDNSDYLYNREDLALLKGKTFHKKKNLVNGFRTAYIGIVKKINDETVADAVSVLNNWKADRAAHGGDDGDFLQCSLAIQYYKELGLSGIVLYADGKPAAFSLGEFIAGGKMFCTHFEKGIDSFHGVYQAVNNEQAKVLPDSVEFINREQDLGDLGLRQAKMTYRPCGFVNKYKVCMKSLVEQKTN